MARAGQRDEAAAFTLGEILHEHILPAGEGSVMFLRAHAATAQQVPGSRKWVCVQSLRPLARELEARGHTVLCEPPDDANGYDQVLVLPPRQRDEARASLARAVASTRPGGRVLASMSNLEGARSVERDLQELIGPIEHASRNKCRVFGGVVTEDRVDRDLVDTWLALDAPRPILEERFISRPGLFAWDRVDAASALLAAHLPTTLAGQVADLGAGWGYLSVQVLRKAPGITGLDLYEAEGRALEPARENLRRAVEIGGRDIPFRVHWQDVTLGIPMEYDVVICNPPFHHHGRADRPDLGQAFIRSAAGALRPGGSLWMVANRHLPYEAILARCFDSVRTVAEEGGFKVVHAVRGKAEPA